MKFLEDYEYSSSNPVPSCPSCGSPIIWGEISWGCGQRWVGWSCSTRNTWDFPYEKRCKWQECDESDFDWATRWYSMEIGGDIGDPAGYYWDHAKNEPKGRLKLILEQQKEIDENKQKEIDKKSS